MNVGTNTIAVTATDPIGNTRTNNYQISVPSGTSTTLLYDLNGNLTSDGSKTYEWDSANRCIAINLGTHRTEMTYDGEHREISRIEKENGTITETKRFIWDHWQRSEERDANNQITKRFYAGGEQIGGSAYFYSRDHLASIREFTDSTGVVRVRYDYDPYGVRTKPSGDLEADFGFTGYYVSGQYADLAFAPLRIYSTNLGRWINRDPIAEAGGINLYRYMANDSVNGLDPLGLWQVSLGAGYGYAALITFGHNNGQWNASAIVGVGIGIGGSFNPNDNTQGHLPGDTVHLGVAAQAMGGVPELLEGSGGFAVTGEANKCNDYWAGTTVNGGFGNLYLGDISGSAWAGGTGNANNGTLQPSVGASSNGWGWSGGAFAIVGATGGVTWH